MQFAALPMVHLFWQDPAQSGQPGPVMSQCFLSANIVGRTACLQSHDFLGLHCIAVANLLVICFLLRCSWDDIGGLEDVKKKLKCACRETCFLVGLVVCMVLQCRLQNACTLQHLSCCSAPAQASNLFCLQTSCGVANPAC